ncbi:MAG: HEAT repeat domain-containing protein [Planctomycetota bacterium]
MPITLRHIIFIAIALVAVSTPLFSDADWDKAKKEFIADGKSYDEDVRVTVTAKLIDNMSPAVEGEVVILLSNQILSELGRNKKGKKEEAVSIKVIDTCVEGLRRIKEDKAVKMLIDNGNKKNEDWRFRFYVIKALGGVNKPEVVKALVSLIKDQKITVQIAAFRALGQLKAPDALEPAAELLIGKSADSPANRGKANWQVKLAVIDYCRALCSAEALKPLKAALKERNTMEPRVFSALLKALEEVTKKMPAEGNDPLLTTKGIILGEYYGTPIESSNIVFLMDTSGSMEAPVKYTPPPPEKEKEKITISGAGPGAGEDKKPAVPEHLRKRKNELDKKPVKTRLDAVKKELINAIYNLDETVNFSIIFYSSGVRAWKIRTIPANFENKLSAINAVDRQNPDGATTIYDALEYAYKIMVKTSSKKPDSPLEEVDGADTFYLLTDGYPTEGKIVDPKAIIEAIRKINEIRQVKINTIAIGSPGAGAPNVSGPSLEVNNDFLKQLAEITGGTFVDKTK